jgi:predicted metalloprotease
MRWDDFRRSDNVEDRRAGGGRVRVGGGIGIGGLLVVLLVSYLTGINPMTLLGGYAALNGGTEMAQRGPSGTPGDAEGQFVGAVLGETEATWTEIFQTELNATYPEPRLVLFAGLSASACGTAEAAMGPFYCPLDQTVYLDTSFFEEMRTRFRACPMKAGGAGAGSGAGPGDADPCAFAQAYVIAHEVGHHVQHALGILDKVADAKRRLDRAEANALSVRAELQADCLAGVWAHHTQQRLRFLDPGDIEAALQTASAIGDDRLQREGQGYVVPDSFTHGTSDQRRRWFTRGLESGALTACDTFQARQL